MDITMSRVRSASDTCNIYFTYTKVNHLLYTCSLDPFEDGILLDTPLVCMHRYCRNTTDDEEECKRQGTTTPSAREAWKRRRKKTQDERYYRPHQAVLPLEAPSGTTAKLPLYCRSTRQIPVLERLGSDTTARSKRHYRLQAVLPPSQAVLPLCLCAAAGLWPCIHPPLTPSWLRL